MTGPGAASAETQALLKAVALSGLPPFTELSPQEARVAFQQRLRATDVPATALPVARDLTLPGPVEPLRARLYSPRALPAAPQPLVLFFHGGGMVIGNLETHDNICRYIAKHADCMVLAIDYRLAPEHRYPAAVDDARGAFAWLLDNAASIGADRTRLAVAGDSAGGTLAALVAQRARDLGVRLALQVLVYPALDQGGDYPSRSECAQGYLLTTESIAWFTNHYFGDQNAAADPRASPCRADVSGVAPALIITAGLDPLRDEAKAYAELLAHAEIPTTYRCFDGTIHGFLGMGRVIREGRDALDLITAELRRAFA